jgi:DNA polymerase-3 subunit gamma/tau
LSYLVLARKWRPQTFRDLIGQEHVSQTLKNAIESGRVAHAFLFTGARGVGKTSSARILAKTLNCEQGPTTEPCNVCPACMEITAGTSVDVFEIDGASNTGVDDIRELRDNVKYLPSRSRYKIFIIDEVHMLSTSAFNALLKTLEEPPPHVKFIFATTEPHKVPITILSRCQRFDFKRIPLMTVVAHLRHIVDQEGIHISAEALTVVARKGDGSMRDSLSTLDQVLAFCGDQVADEEVVALLGVVDRRLLADAAAAVLARDTRTALEIVKRVDEFGYNMRQFCQELIDQFRVLLLCKAVDAVEELVELSDHERESVQRLAQQVDLTTVQRALAILLRADSDMAHSSFARLILEMALVRMATLAPVIPVNELLDRLKALEKTGGSGAGGSLPPPSGDGRQSQASAAARPVSAPAVSSPAKPAPQVPPPPASPSVSVAAEPLPAGARDWPGFVAAVKARKPMLASLLEKGSPMQVADGQLTIGFAKGSFELSRAQDKEVQDELRALAGTFFGSPVELRVTALSDNGENAPLSLAEKKSREQAVHRQELKNLAEGHPLVKAAVEIFNGSVEGYEELKH